MSAAAAPKSGDATAKGSNKKLIIIIIAAVAVLLVGIFLAAFALMKQPAEGEDEYAEAQDTEEVAYGGKPALKHAQRPERKKDAPVAPPTFVPLEPFIVNLADRDSERFAQIGIQLQLEDPKVAEELKAYMPAIRNAVLLILAHKTSEELLSPEGKMKLAEEIRRESARAMGYAVEEPEDVTAAMTEAQRRKKRRRSMDIYNPIVQVHYSNFIIQ